MPTTIVDAMRTATRTESRTKSGTATRTATRTESRTESGTESGTKSGTATRMYVTLLRCCGAFFVRDPLSLEGSARRQQPELWRAVATRHHEPASCSVRRRTAVQLLANE